MMAIHRPDNPLIVQGDHTVLVEVDSPRYEAARDGLARFAELIKSPEHIHTYRITPLSIWNACAAGIDTTEIVQTLQEFSKYDVPQHVAVEIREYASRYGRLRLERDEAGLGPPGGRPAVGRGDQPQQARRAAAGRAAFADGLPRGAGRPRTYQAGAGQDRLSRGRPGRIPRGRAAADRLAGAHRFGSPLRLAALSAGCGQGVSRGRRARGGSGVIVLPCGAGKTIVGMACMAEVQSSTLVLTTSVTATRQWIAELLDKTTLQADQVGEYNGSTKDVRPVTVATYNIMTWRPRDDAEFTHLQLFDQRNWGLIIYDEVHLLPAPVFQVTAGLQARRRLGLTATLVREDGREDDVFALIGPKKVDVPWKVLEGEGWIATATCTEIRLPLPEELRMPYAVADARQKFRIASENPLKLAAVREVLKRHPGEPTLIIGMYVEQIKQIAAELGVPVLTGTTAQRKRDAIYEDFKAGRIGVLAVSKIANFAVDLPDAAVAIQVSGTFGSRQEEAQRLGRILRPKPGANQAHFYTIVSRDTVEQDFALKRQLFLCEQGYAYEIRDAGENGGET